MFYFLISAAFILFAAHVLLLVASFIGPKFGVSRYFYSHLTLWLTGLVVFVLALNYSGTGQSGFLDYFNSPIKQGAILAFTLALSITAHGIVKFLILPLVQKSKP